MPKIYKAWHIYTLSDPDTLEVRYVGVTCRSLKARLQAHWADCHHKLKDGTWEHNHHAANWLRKMRAKHCKPIIQSIEQGEGLGWIEREVFWIKYYREAGARLTNTTDGGQGNWGWSPTPEMRKASSKRALKQWENPEHRQRIAAASARNWVEQREFMSQSIRKAQNDPHVKQQMSERKRGMRHHGARLTDETVIQLRQEAQKYPHGTRNVFYAAKAAEFGVGVKQIVKVVEGRAWKHLQIPVKTLSVSQVFAALHALQIDQKTLADAAQLSRQTLADMLNQRVVPRKTTIYSLLRTLENLGVLFEGEEVKLTKTNG